MIGAFWATAILIRNCGILLVSSNKDNSANFSGKITFPRKKAALLVYETD